MALVLAVFGVLDAVVWSVLPGPDLVNAVVLAAAALCLAWRRTRPLLAFTGALSGLTVLALVFGHYESSASVFVAAVAVYSAAAYGSNLPYAIGVAAGFSAALNLGQPRTEAISDLLWTAGALSLMFGAGLATRAYRARTSALEAQNEALEREQDERAEAAAGAERRRIARELHDIIAHGLGAVVVQAGGAEQILDRDPERARDVLRSIQRTGQEAIDELGRLVALVRGTDDTSLQPQPSLADLDGLIARTREAGLMVDLATEGEPRAIPAAVQLSAYRTVQEGLTNALKHAGRAEVHVVLRFLEQELEVEVADNGARDGSGPGGKLGLAGLRERVSVFGGRLEAGPHPGGGWTLRAAYPLVR